MVDKMAEQMTERLTHDSMLFAHLYYWAHLKTTTCNVVVMLYVHIHVCSIA